MNPELISLEKLTSDFRALMKRKRYDECEKDIVSCMAANPHAAQPHNLMGVLKEAQGDHTTAMKHFRAAWALDPAYLPARYNMELTGSFFGVGMCAVDESDCMRRCS